jgi:phosphoribosyl-AMP cyclohydrolase
MSRQSPAAGPGPSSVGGSSAGPSSVGGSSTTPSSAGPSAADWPAAGPQPADPVPAAPALAPQISARLKRDQAGLVPAIAQQYDTGEVLMLGWMDDEALRRTLTTGRCTYWSRSRQEYWTKGETSGHAQWVQSVALDCDGDTILVKVDQVGAACHTGDRTCFDAGALDTVRTDRPRQA